MHQALSFSDDRRPFNKKLFCISFLFFSLVVIIVWGSSNSVRKRITENEELKEIDLKHEGFPWMVALTKKSEDGTDKYFCSGTLISSKHVITGNLSVHCLIFYFQFVM